MMDNESVKIGIVGCEGYAYQLIIRIQTIPLSGEITAVVALDPSSDGANYCRAHGIRVFPTVDEMLASGGFDVVMNLTPIHFHAEISKQCLAAGFPVWMEKPPVATVQDLDSLNTASLAAGLPITVCFNTLFAFRAQQLKAELLAEKYGKIGRVKLKAAWSRTSAYFTRCDWAGKLNKEGRWVLDGDINNPLSHFICAGLFFAGRDQASLANPVSVQAELYRANQIESEDTSAIRIHTEEGVEILSWLTLASEGGGDALVVIETEKAVINFINLDRIEIAYHDGSTESRGSYKESRIEMIEHLCRSLRGHEVPISSLAAIRPFTVAVNAAFESAGIIQSIPEEALDVVALDKGETHVIIKGISDIFERAFEASALFSEIGVPWACRSEVFDAKDYSNFPVRFQAQVKREEALKA